MVHNMADENILGRKFSYTMEFPLVYNMCLRSLGWKIPQADLSDNFLFIEQIFKQKECSLFFSSHGKLPKCSCLPESL